MKTTRKITKVLIANRGEIAVRVIRGCRDMGIATVAVFSDADRDALHVRLADEAVHIGPAPASESYLIGAKIISAAKETKATAIHPGYGFLSENADFAQACSDAGLIFIGPKPETIITLGDKIQARKMALGAGLQVAPGVDMAITDVAIIQKEMTNIGYPALIKAAAGGGGKGMRIVRSDSELVEAIAAAGREAQSAFGDSRVFIEKYIERPRHIEIQIFGDAHGSVVHLNERECSIQRRHQKVFEEAPSSFVDDDLRSRMGQAAVAIGKEANYLGAGTVEFLVDSEKNFYFLEVNTRLQVEHPVTELITGIDLVREQINVAEGKPLSFTQSDITLSGWAFEARIYAEIPEDNFLPSTGKITLYQEPSGPGIRVDSGVRAGSEVSVYYDPLLAKLCAYGSTRDEAIARMLRALAEYRIVGVNTTVEFSKVVFDDETFRSGDISTAFLSERFPDNVYGPDDAKSREAAALIAAVAQFRENSRSHPTQNSAYSVNGSSPNSLESSTSAVSQWKRRGRSLMLRRK
ncbi:acetyl-CoA carboxylase biotin carboxylase subunit [bacterium AH-315-J21]|nr:acetyl-CoA carboxylase biotin carboxylase subunit [bacterium AH-315-J21]